MQKQLLRARRLTGLAVRGADLVLAAGDFAVILGPEGSGKSALLCLLGFAAKPDSGDLFLEGRLVAGLDPPEMARLRQAYIGQAGPFGLNTPVERRLAAIHRAVGRRPLILLLAEPLAGLHTGDECRLLMEAIRHLNQGGLTILLTTTDPETAAYGNRLYRMADGILTAITKA